MTDAAPVNPRRRRALTLIETLLAILLLSLAATLLATGFSGGDGVALREALAAWSDLDQRARLTARRGTPCELHIAEDRRAIRVVPDSIEDDSAMTRDFAAAVQAFVESADDLERVRFFTDGRSDDYTIILRAGDQLLSRHVNGRTGLFTPPEGST